MVTYKKFENKQLNKAEENFSKFYPLDDIKHGRPNLSLETAIEKGQSEEEGW